MENESKKENIIISVLKTISTSLNPIANRTIGIVTSMLAGIQVATSTPFRLFSFFLGFLITLEIAFLKSNGIIFYLLKIFKEIISIFSGELKMHGLNFLVLIGVLFLIIDRIIKK